MSDKIKSAHLARKAILYIRQSSGYQVANNLESQRLQYAMQSRLKELGWAEVEIIDEDLGRSASGSVTRAGFERMVAQVCLGNFGAVCARELSRFARNSRDWQQLIEVCRVVDTLLVDHESVYSPRHSNDRLLLGLKGSLNEYELDLLRQRASEARVQKAKRGELVSHCPVGFVKGEETVLEKHPDQRIQGVINLVFQKMQVLGSARQTALWFIENDLAVPSRTLRGEIHWRRASYSWVHRLLTHPAYGGAYVYGRTANVTCYTDGVSRQRPRRRPQDEWVALIPGAHEGYVSWEDFKRIRAMIAGNVLGGADPSAGTRHGSALLTGLLRCHRCARMLRTFYKGPDGDSVRYACVRAALDTKEARCIAFSGATVDAAVSREILTVVQPAAIAATVSAQQQLVHEREQVLATLRKELEAAQYQALRAQRQYDAADPDNRLVAGELERRWNQTLHAVQAVEAKIAEHLEQDTHATASNEHEFAALARDLEAVWNDPQADEQTKKRILRALIRELVVDIDQDTNEIVVVIHWKGGVHTSLRLPRRRRGQNAMQTSKDVIDAVRSLARICNDDRIAGFLNRQGLRTVRGKYWTRALVTALRCHHGIECYCAERQRTEGWMNLTQAAAVLGVTNRTLRLAIESGAIKAERPIAYGPWVLNASDLRTECALKFAEAVRASKQRGTIPSPSQSGLDLSMT